MENQQDMGRHEPAALDASRAPSADAEPAAAHTPGPWVCYADLPSTEPDWHIVTTSNRLRVLANVHIEPGNKTDEANARLIAAAPDLLAALLGCIPQLELGNGEAEHVKAAHAAIAKATGEPS